MGEEAWSAGFNQCFGVALAGDLIGDVDERGEPILGDSILVLMNAYHEAIPFKLPTRFRGQRWERVIDTADPKARKEQVPANKRYNLSGRSVVVLRSSQHPPKIAEDASAPADGAAERQGEAERESSPVPTQPAETP